VGLAPLYLRLIFLVLLPLPVSADDLQFITHSSLQQTYKKDGELRGKPHAGRRAFYVEVVREMMTILNVPQIIDDYPLARGIQDVQTKDNIAFFNLTRTPEREDTVKWVVQLLETSSFFYETKDAPTHIQSLEDAKKVKSIGVLRGGIHESLLKSLGFTNLYPMESYNQILTMLSKGRINLTASAGYFSAIQSADLDLSKIQITTVKVNNSVGYLCFSKNVSDVIVRQWQDAFEQIKRAGRLEKLTNEYLLPKNQ
jgi:polar amino acid transport system substrate-binding protein